MESQVHLEELAALERLAEFLATASADGAPGRCHAMAQAMAIRLATLAAGARITSEASDRADRWLIASRFLPPAP